MGFPTGYIGGVLEIKNQYEVVDSQVVIYLKRRDGSIYETIIDLVDFDLVNSVEGTWCVAFDKSGKVGSVVKYSKTIDGKKIGKDIKLHRLIMGVYGNGDATMVVDHIDRSPLNNTRENLRLCTVAENSQNRSKNKQSKSNVRGVTWSPTNQRWQARCQVDGIRHNLGFYKTIEEAEQVVKEFRQKNTASID